MMKPLNPKIHCLSGLSMSVQASETHYCTPRDDNGPYYSVEIGFPSMPLPELNEWADGPIKEDGRCDVYGYVPVPELLKVIEANGGIVEGKLPQH